MVEKVIKMINEECRENRLEDQGIFIEPFGIKLSVKEHVLYGRYNTGGMTGGGWQDDAKLVSYTNGYPDGRFPEVIELTAKRLLPDITEEEITQLYGLVTNNDYTDDSDYYGNTDDYEVRYVILSQFEELIEKFRNEREKTATGE